MENRVENLLLLGTIPKGLIRFFREKTTRVIAESNPVDRNYIDSCRIDYIISYRYRHIIKPEIINRLPGRIVNLHISMLPWNRGADPNLWSFLEDTPKGISIHYVDTGIDTGDLLLQKSFEFDDRETLASTYEILNNEILNLLQNNWDHLSKNKISPIAQDINAGSHHFLKDKVPYLGLIAEKGWNTRVGDLRGKAL